MEKTKCDLCGSTLGKPFLKHDFLSFPCRVSMCLNCGFLKLNPRWSESKYNWFYKKKYDFFYRDPGKSAEELFALDSSTKGKKMAERFKALPFPARVKMLDIGAGTGFSFYSLPKGIQVESYAIEGSPKCVPFLRSKGISVIGSDFSGNFGNGYDLVVIRSVLEHVLDPLHFLRKIGRSLKDDGRLYLAVPNAMNFNEEKAHSFFRHVHTYYFNPRTLLQMCRTAGFSPVKFGQEDDVWAVMKKGNGESQAFYSLPEISPRDQLEILKKYIHCSRLPIKRRLVAFARRLAYGAF